MQDGLRLESSRFGVKMLGLHMSYSPNSLKEAIQATRVQGLGLELLQGFF